VDADAIARRITLRELRLVLAVARSGSILKAATEVGLTQPALSRCVSELEATFGLKLFDRTNRGIVPTPHGEVVLRHAAGVFEELRQAVNELGSLTKGGLGDVRLGGTPTICAGLLPKAVGSLIDRHANLRFRLAELELEKLAGEVSARSLDFGVGREPNAIDDNLLFEHLFDDRLFVVAGCDHSLANRRSVTLEATSHHPWALPTSEGAMMFQLRREFARRRLEPPNPTVGTMSVLIRYQLMKTNHLLTVMYGSILRFGNLPSFLRVLPIDMTCRVPIGIIRRKNRTLAASGEAVLQVLRDLSRPMRSISAAQLRKEVRS
jgi:DNA-binding transcriptional LysR family regulator